jgi:prevent-host-death family protein
MVRRRQLLRCVAVMESRTIPQRELRNNVAEVLRRAEAGTEFTITVRGRPVARLGPAVRPHERRLDVDRDTFSAILAATHVDDDLGRDIAAARNEEEPVGDPWDRS